MDRDMDKGKSKRLFNQRGRKQNALFLAVASLCSNILILLTGFAYRTIFLRYLSQEYLGLSGLFSNVLQVLSLADIGFFSVVTYRLYEPISRGDINRLNALMRHLRKIFYTIVCVILISGLLIAPFINFLINDTGEIPRDINVHLIYILFLFQTVVSYVGVYRQCLLVADQKSYVQSIFLTVFHIVQNTIQIVIIMLYHNYTFSLISGLIIQLLYNILLSIYVTANYAPVFKGSSELEAFEKISIRTDSVSYFIRKIGYVVLYSTDSIVISKYLGLAITGLYSNYFFIVNYLQNFIGQLFESFISSIGNAQATVDREYNYIIYSRIVFANLWLSSIISVCTAVLIDGFIVIWVGDKMLLGNNASFVLSLQLYIIMMNKCNTSFIEGCGLFKYDKYRPLLGALANLVLSVLLVRKIGISGVFWGTIVAQLFVNFWRDIFILHKYEFKKSVFPILRMNFVFMAISIVEALMYLKIFSIIVRTKASIFGWLFEAILVFISSNIVLLLVFYRSDYFDYYKKIVFGKIKKLGG